MILILNILCSVLFITGLWFVGHKTWRGWLIVLVAQVVWLPLVIHWTIVQGWDVVVLWVSWFGVTINAIVNLRKWRKTENGRTCERT